MELIILIYVIIAVLSALIISVKEQNQNAKDFVRSLFLGVVWPLTWVFLLFIAISSVFQKAIADKQIKQYQRQKTLEKLEKEQQERRAHKGSVFKA